MIYFYYLDYNVLFVILLLFSFHQVTCQMHNRKQVTQYVGLLAKAKTTHPLRGNPNQNSSYRSSIDEYQDHDKDSWL